MGAKSISTKVMQEKYVWNQHNRNRIELKPLTNKYRDNYNRHVLKFDTAQKLCIINMAEIDSSTALYYIVNLLARILKK